MEHKKQLWQLIYERLSGELSDVMLKTWFDDTSVVSLTADTLTLYTPSSFKRPIIMERFLPALQKTMRELLGGEYEIVISDTPEAAEPESNTEEEENPYGHYSFSNFVVGNSNKFAHAAAMAVTISSAHENNPLFIYGQSGLGKTHLLYAIMNKIKKANPTSLICAVTAEQFTNEIIAAIRTKRNFEFHKRYRSVDMLLVDDIQFIGGMDFAQEEFFNTFNTLYLANHHLVFTSDRPPREIPLLSERLRSRFESGLIIDIQPPDFETRVAIVKNKSLSLGLELPDNVGFYIAENVTSNVRQLEGAVKKIMAYRSLMDYPLNMETAKHAISDLFSENPGLNPTPDLIIREVCQYYNVDIQEIKGSSRRAAISKARQIAIYLMRSLLDISMPAIGEIFNRDHTTILHAINQVDTRKQKEGDNTAKEIDTIIRNIRG